VCVCVCVCVSLVAFFLNDIKCVQCIMKKSYLMGVVRIETRNGSFSSLRLRKLILPKKN
jgi:hypothetical protein